MSDLHTQKQLISGFYQLESGAWRWTGQKFVVSLKVPSGAEKSGALLVLQGHVLPETLQNKPLQISAVVNGVALPVQTITKPGELLYRCRVPAVALFRPVVLAEFSLDHTHRVQGDNRDLGIVASVISLR